MVIPWQIVCNAVAFTCNQTINVPRREYDKISPNNYCDIIAHTLPGSNYVLCKSRRCKPCKIQLWIDKRRSLIWFMYTCNEFDTQTLESMLETFGHSDPVWAVFNFTQLDLTKHTHTHTHKITCSTWLSEPGTSRTRVWLSWMPWFTHCLSNYDTFKLDSNCYSRAPKTLQ